MVGVQKPRRANLQSHGVLLQIKLHFSCSAVWRKSKMTFHHKEQIPNNKHHFLKNNWIASPFWGGKKKWRWHDILSVSAELPGHLCVDSTTHLPTWYGFLNSQVLLYPSQRKSEAKLIPLDHAVLLLMALSLPESRDSTELVILETTADELLPKWHALKKKKRSH